jgi:hypothetical protein
MRLGDADSPWRPFRATQHYAADPPGFVWDATVTLPPRLPVRVLDAYADGRGVLRADLLSTVPVAEAPPSPETNEGELLRYLAEAVWFPTALLPDAGVGWEAIDRETARATLRDGDVVAAAVFRFDPGTGLVTEVTADRYRAATGAVERWTGRFDDYEVRSGLRVPTRASVAWSLPAGDLPYWRGTVERISYLDGGD